MSYLSDTSPSAERMQIEAIRKMSVGRRVALMRKLTADTHQRAMTALHRARPDLDEIALRLWFIELNYGADLARKVEARMQQYTRNGRV